MYNKLTSSFKDEMSKRKSHLYNIYANPLPINLSKFSIKNIVFGFDIPQDEIIVYYQDEVFKTKDAFSTEKLWFNGFFGKGSLSRSQPTFSQRTKRRLLIDQDSSSLTSEEITKLRREERLHFKLKRLELESLENLYKINNDLESLEKIEIAKNELIKSSKLKKPIDQLFKEYYKPLSLRLEDENLVADPSCIDELEYLQLLPSEVLFLSLLNRVKVMTFDPHGDERYLPFKELAEIIIPSFQSKDFQKFVVYFYYKSLGWCVKSGVKFSTDFILYEKGPVFNHANFAILIPDSDMDWIKMNSISRVVGGVKKRLVMTFVEFSDEFDNSIEQFNQNGGGSFDDDDDEEEISRLKFLNVLKCCNVNEIGLNRWSSTRNRE